MGKYKIDFRRLVVFLSIILTRVKINIEYVFTLLNPVRRLHYQFSNHITETDKSLSYNSQYPNMQRLLNDMFDDVDRRIEVRDGDAVPRLLFYPNNERKPVMFGQHIFHPNGSWGHKPFNVIVPEEILTTDIENQIRRILDEYKFAGTNYKIITK